MSRGRMRTGGDVRATSKRKPTAGSRLASPDDAVLVPIDAERPDVFLLLSSEWLDVGERISGPLPPAVTTNLLDRIGTSTALANVGLQGLKGLQSCQGLVRLAPETLALMQQGANPITAGGYNLGTLATNGRFVAQVRWLPAAGASAAGVLAALGPAVAMAAMQLQLAAISKKLDRVIAISSEVLQASRREKWATVWGEMDMLRRALDEVQQLGEINDNAFAEARGAYRILNASRHQLRLDVGDHRRQLASPQRATARQDWLADHADVVLQDLQCLVLTSVGCLLYEELRAEHADLTNLEHGQIIRARAIEEARQEREEIGATLTSVVRTLHLLAADPGKKRIYMLGKDRVPARVADAATELADAVEGLGVHVESPLIAGAHAHGRGQNVGQPVVTSEPWSTLRWHLEPGEQMQDAWLGKDGMIVGTARRLFYVRRSKPSRVEWSLEWDQVQGTQAVDDWGWTLRVFEVSGKERNLEVGSESAARAMAAQVAARQKAVSTPPLRVAVTAETPG